MKLVLFRFKAFCSWWVAMLLMAACTSSDAPAVSTTHVDGEAEGETAALHFDPKSSAWVTLCHHPDTSRQRTIHVFRRHRVLIRWLLSRGDELGECEAAQPPGMCDAPAPVPETPAGDEPTEEPELISKAEVMLAGVATERLNPADKPFSFMLSCPTLDVTSPMVYIDGIPAPAGQLAADASTLTLSSGLSEGRHQVELVARDIFGYSIYYNVVLWFGSGSLTVIVKTPDGQPAAASVALQLTDAPTVGETLMTDANGQVTFEALPNRTYGIIARNDTNEIASSGVVLADSPVTLTLVGFGTPSDVDNNDFSQGSDGWDFAPGTVSIVPHASESASQPATAAKTASRSPSTPEELAAARKASHELHKLSVAQPARPAASTTAAAAPDLDLQLVTSGEGPQHLSRTFTVEPGVRAVSVRYRFITTEVPGGWFGSEFNDYFSVAIRSQKTGASIVKGNSMNGLGLGAFDAAGATQWYEQELKVAKDGDVVQLDLVVANVADDLLDSALVVDAVKEKTLVVSALQLNDIDNTPLTFASAAQHAYFSGNTRFHGTITVEGNTDDTLRELRLELVQDGTVIATGKLAPALEATLYKAFGDPQKLSLTSSQLMFNVVSADVAGRNNITLRVVARSDAEETTKEGVTLPKLERFTGTNRYGGRDENRGGDDWVDPKVRDFIDSTSGFIWGDMSNMHGGSFAPDHASHRLGQSADGWFMGYNARTAAVANTIIGHLNQHGTRIRTVYVTFTPAFSGAIQNVMLNDGRLATDVIRNQAGHDTHFHWEINP